MKKIIYIIIIFSVVSFAVTASAASLILGGQSSVPINQELKVNVMIDAENQNLNAFEGALTFPSRLLEIKQISDGDSIVNFWIERPHPASSTDSQTGTITWSGITPQGFQGVLGPYLGEKPGKLFSVVFSPVDIGNGQITALNLRALIGDGQGNPANISAAPLSFSISGASGENISPLQDLKPPENFRPEIASDPSIFNGRYFIVFSARDVESGINRYEVMETRDESGQKGEWVAAESPYLLKNQGLSSFIFVKAVDKTGNERTERIDPLRLQRWYESWALWIIIITVILSAVLLWKRK